MHSSDFVTLKSTKPLVPLLKATIPTNELKDVDIKLLWNSCGYSTLDIPRLRQWFNRYAKVEPAGLDQSMRMSLGQFVEFLHDAQVYFPNEAYYEQMFHTFNTDRSEELNFKEFCMGMMLVDPDIPRHPGRQWFRCRLEFIFHFYDLDHDEYLCRDELFHLLRHLVRENIKGPPKEVDAGANALLQTISTCPNGYSFIHFVDMVENEWFQGHCLHLSQIVIFPSFRTQLSNVNVQLTKRSSLRVSKRSKVEEKKVSFTEVTNCVPIEIQDGHTLREVPVSQQPAHTHTKNLSRKRISSLEPEESKTSTPPMNCTACQAPLLGPVVEFTCLDCLHPFCTQCSLLETLPCQSCTPS